MNSGPSYIFLKTSYSMPLISDGCAKTADSDVSIKNKWCCDWLNLIKPVPENDKVSLNSIGTC